MSVRTPTSPAALAALADCEAAAQAQRDILAAARLAAGLERLQSLHDEMARRHRLLSTGLGRLEGLRATMIAQLDRLTPDADLEPSLGFVEFHCIDWRNHRDDPWPEQIGASDDREMGDDDEPNLGWESHGAQVRLDAGAHDHEPSLGWPERMNQVAHRGSATDHEDEPSLGAVNGTGPYADQRDWDQGAAGDLEEEHDGREPDVDDEPSLGSLEAPQRIVVTERDPETGRALRYELTDPADQHSWGYSSGGDAEEQCEDEGGACEDEGADCDREPDDWGWEAPDGGTAYPSAVGAWPPAAA